jgi:hypothetical protein
MIPVSADVAEATFSSASDGGEEVADRTCVSTSLSLSPSLKKCYVRMGIRSRCALALAFALPDPIATNLQCNTKVLTDFCKTWSSARPPPASRRFLRQTAFQPKALPGSRASHGR